MIGKKNWYSHLASAQEEWIKRYMESVTEPKKTPTMNGIEHALNAIRKANLCEEEKKEDKSLRSIIDDKIRSFIDNNPKGYRGEFILMNSETLKNLSTELYPLEYRLDKSLRVTGYKGHNIAVTNSLNDNQFVIK